MVEIKKTISTMRLGLNGHATERPRTGSTQLGGGDIVADRNIISTKDIYQSIQEEINCAKLTFQGIPYLEQQELLP